MLAELEQDLQAVVSPDARKLEQSLSGLERMLSDALRSVVSSEQLAAVEAEVKKQLQPYRKHMEPAVYQQTFENLLLKRLREQFGIPRSELVLSVTLKDPTEVRRGLTRRHADLKK